MDFDPDKVLRFSQFYGTKDHLLVHASDYDALLQLYRDEQVKSANAAFNETSDSAVCDEQAKDIQRLQARIVELEENVARYRGF